MLVELNIENYAIIDTLRISFSKGLNVISGETGAGKSIIIGAINLLLGGRASSEDIKSSRQQAVVEGFFDISGYADLKAKLLEMGFDTDSEDTLVVRRILSRSGKNKIYLNGSPVTLSMLASLSEFLVDVCSQNEQQVLMNTEHHIDILDTYGGLWELREDYVVLYGRYRQRLEHLEVLKRMQREKSEQEDILTFQLQQIMEAQVSIGEDLSLQEEKEILGNVKQLREYAAEAYEILYLRRDAIFGELGKVIELLAKLNNIDPRLTLLQKKIETMYYDAEDASLVLRDYPNSLSFDPARLEEIEVRLEILKRIKRKYGGSLETVIQKKEEIQKNLSTLTSLDEEIRDVEASIDCERKLVLEKAQILSRERRKAALSLQNAIQKEVAAMMMPHTKFEARFIRDANQKNENAFDARGIDRVEFFLSTNHGEELKHLNRVASGGEMSRIILSIKKVLAHAGAVPTVIFDEVDSGIGGATAEAVGSILKEVSRHHQVICITHLPQIACFGESHFRVSKETEGKVTQTRLTLLTESERVEEITRMLGGMRITDKMKEAADEMIRNSVRH